MYKATKSHKTLTIQGNVSSDIIDSIQVAGYTITGEEKCIKQ